MRKLKSALPWIALASAIVAAGLLIAGSLYRKAQIVDTGETRAVVEKALDGLLQRQPVSIDETGFTAALEDFARSPYVASTFLVDTKGTVYGIVTGSINVGGDSADRGAGMQSLTNRSGLWQPGNVEGLPPDEFSPEQLLLLATKSAMEGRDADHGDVFATLVRTVRNGAGEPLGAIGVRYDRSPWVGAMPEAVWIALVLGFALFLAIYWISVPAWTFLDARERGEKAWVWAAFTLVGNVIALVAYLLARAPRLAKGT